MTSVPEVYKIIMVGNSGVGKSTFLCQFTEKKFCPQPLTIGVEYGSTIQKVDNRQIKFLVWDTAGQENFRSIIKSYFRNTMGAIVVYDITDRHTFTSIPDWIQMVRANNTSNIPVVLVGNKTDLNENRKVSIEEGMELGSKLKATFLEANSKDYQQVERVYHTLAKMISKQPPASTTPGYREPLLIKSSGKYTKRCCN